MDFSSRKRGFLDNAEKMAATRSEWIKRNSAYYADDYRYMRYLVAPNSRVLDLGCGTGELLAALEPSYGVGVDFSSGMIAEARKRHPTLHFVEGDAERDDAFSHMEGTFDYIIVSDTVGMYEDVGGALRLLHRLCSPDTRIIIAYYSPTWEPLLNLGTKLGVRMPQPRMNHIGRTDFLNILDLAEFEPIRLEQRQLIPFHLLGVGRFINRYIAPLPILRKMCLRTYIVARSRNAKRDDMPSTSIVIPCRNEHGNIERAIRELPRFGGHQEIVFVEGNSKDGTYEECLRVQEAFKDDWTIKVFKQEGRGKGDAVRKGFANSTGDILMILDADLTVPPRELEKFYYAIASGKGEFVNGTRLVYPMEDEAMRPLNFIANRFFAAIFSYLLNQRFTDTLCGTKVLRRDAYDRIVANRSYFGNFDPFGDFDLIFGAAKQSLRIVEVPVHYKARTYGETQISRFRDGWLLLRMVVFAFKKLKAI